MLLRLGSLPFLTTPGLHAGWGAWAATTPPADAVAAVARLMGLGLAMWLLGGTALYLLARLGRLTALVRTCGWIAPRAIRHLVDTAVALAVVASVTAGTAAYAAGPPAPPPPVSHTATSAPQAPPAPSPGATPRAESPASPLASSISTAADTHVVADGESLWSIAATTLAAAHRRGDTEAVARYWVEVVARNRPHLRSGNPNLIFPGEAIALPPLP